MKKEQRRFLGVGVAILALLLTGCNPQIEPSNENSSGLVTKESMEESVESSMEESRKEETSMKETEEKTTAKETEEKTTAKETEEETTAKETEEETTAKETEEERTTEETKDPAAGYDFTEEELFEISYSLNRNDSYGSPYYFSLINAKGKLLVDSARGEENRYYLMKDVVSGKIQYYTREDFTKTSSDSESLTYDYRNVLLNSDGEEVYLIDGTLYQLFDHYIIIGHYGTFSEPHGGETEGLTYQLVDINTREVLFTSYHLIKVVNNKLYVDDVDAMVLKIYRLDDFSLMKEIPGVQIEHYIGYENRFSGYYLVSKGELGTGYGLMNENDEVVISPVDGASYMEIFPSKKYACVSGDSQYLIYALDTPDHLMGTYSDSCINYTEEYALFKSYEEGLYVLFHNGERKELPYTNIGPVFDSKSGDGNTVYLAYNTDFNQDGEWMVSAVLLDSEFHEFFSFTKNYSHVQSSEEGLIFAMGDEGIDIYQPNGICVLENAHLYFPYEAWDWDDRSYIYTINEDGTRNIYNPKMELLGEHLPVGGISNGNGYYLGRKGFYYGLMDFDGNWIYRFSVFSNMGD